MDTIHYSEIISKYPWIVKKNQDCILSPDSDGLLCGLFMSSQLGWKIRGFYDVKILVLEKGFKPKDCIFLDVEIFRKEIKSVGQHMVMFDKKELPLNWSNFDNCIAANNLRNFDFKNDFKLKYPLGTIHLLLAILGQKQKISITKSAISPLLYTDGTFKNQFNYPENCISWFEFLKADDSQNPLQKIFLDKHYSTHELMSALKDLFAEIHAIGGGKHGGDKIKISNSKGQIVNIDQKSGYLNGATKSQAEELLKMLATKTGWSFNSSNWSWGPYCTFKFKKGSIKPGKTRYNGLLAQNPISLAIISRNSVEYTIDDSGIF